VCPFSGQEVFYGQNAGQHERRDDRGHHAARPEYRESVLDEHDNGRYREYQRELHDDNAVGAVVAEVTDAPAAAPRPSAITRFRVSFGSNAMVPWELVLQNQRIGVLEHHELRGRWHLIPGAAFERAPCFLLLHTAPLLEEEGYAGLETLIANAGDPLGVHWSRARP
jgi:hypothetical protein